MTRRYVEDLTVDAKQCLETVAKDTDDPDYNIVDAHIAPEELKIPRGKDLDPEAVIAARRREIQNLIDFEAFEWVRNEDIDPSGKWISSRWEDLANSDPRKPPVRSRCVLQEVATYKSDDFFAATATTMSGRIIDLLAVHNGWPIADADVTTAFTHATEEELIYTAPADGWRKPGWSWRLPKNINGEEHQRQEDRSTGLVFPLHGRAEGAGLDGNKK